MTRNQALKLCRQAEKLAPLTDWKKTADSIKQLQLEWQQLKSISRQDSEKLWLRFQTATQLFFDARGKHFVQQDKLRLANKKKAERLISKAIKLAGSSDWKKTGEAIKNLRQDWKTVNPLPQHDSEKLWREFQTVTQSFFDRRSSYFDGLDNQRNQNRQKAEALIKEAQRLSASVDMKQAAEEIKILQLQWKGVNPLPREDAEKLWHQFQVTCQEVFDRRALQRGKKNRR